MPLSAPLEIGALWRQRLAMALALMALVFATAAARADGENFPALTGRVVDAANVIPADARGRIETKLADLEQKSGIQFVVATVPSLGGNAIETYSVDLGRHWALGEKGKNNGVLLLVAPNEHKIRIEVGYGLEATLTDALSKIVISNAIAPRFKTGDYGGGIERGVDDVVTILTTDSSEWSPRPRVRQDDLSSDLDALLPFLIFLLFVIIVMRANRSTGRGRGVIVLPGPGPGWGGGFDGGVGGGGGFSGGGGFDGGGFSGGGGSFGGGGASGDW
jgi:uncharacterized protein